MLTVMSIHFVTCMQDKIEEFTDFLLAPGLKLFHRAAKVAIVMHYVVEPPKASILSVCV